MAGGKRPGRGDGLKDLLNANVEGDIHGYESSAQQPQKEEKKKRSRNKKVSFELEDVITQSRETEDTTYQNCRITTEAHQLISFIVSNYPGKNNISKVVSMLIENFFDKNAEEIEGLQNNIISQRLKGN